MTNFAKLPLSEKLQSARKLFGQIATDTDLQQVLGGYKYGPERIAEGRAILDRLLVLQNEQQQEYGQQYLATDEFRSLREKADATFEHLWKVVRVMIAEDPGLRDRLNLGSVRKHSTNALGEWQAQAEAFYTRLLAAPDLLERLVAVQVSREELEAGLAQCRAVLEADIRQQKEQAEAKESTRLRDEALDELQKWLSLFTATARIALADQPDKLDLLDLKP